MPLPALIVGAIALGGALGVGSLVQRYLFKPRAPEASGNYSGQTQATLAAFEEAERAETYRGLDRIVASARIRRIPASVRLDFARSQNLDTGLLRETLKRLQAFEVERKRENPGELDHGTIWKVAGTQLRRGSFFEGFGMLAEAPARNMDLAASHAQGELDSVGRHTARILGRRFGFEEGDPQFKAVSGALDLSKILVGDTFLVGGKGFKVGRAAIKAPSVAKALPGVRLFASKVARMKDAGEIWEAARVGGGHIELPLAQKIAKYGNTSEDVFRILDENPHLMTTYPSWFRRSAAHATSRAARAPLIRPFTSPFFRVWPSRLDRNHPNFADNFNRMAGFFWKGDEEKRLGWLNKLATASEDRDAMSIAEKMVNEGMASYTKRLLAPTARNLSSRLGVKAKGFDDLADQIGALEDQGELLKMHQRLGLRPDPGSSVETLRTGLTEHITGIPRRIAQEADEALQRRGFDWWTHREKAFGTRLLPDEIRPTSDVPGLETQLSPTIPVPSYTDVVAYTAEVLGRAGAGGLPRLAFRRAVNFVDRHSGWWRAMLLMNPRYAMRNVQEESLALLSHPEYGGLYLRELGSSMADATSRMAAAGMHLLTRGKKGYSFTELRFPRSLRALAKESEERALAAELPDYLTSSTALKSYIGDFGPVSDETVTRLSRMTQSGSHATDHMAWMYVPPDQPGFVSTWYHAVNHQLLGDRGVKLALTYWDDPAKMQNELRTFVASREGKHYLARMPEEWSKNPERWIASRAEYVKAMLPTDELVDMARDGKVPTSALKRAFDSGTHPPMVQGPVSVVGELVGPTATRSTGMAMSKLCDKSFGWAGAFVDYFGRRPGFRAVFKGELKRLDNLVTERGLNVHPDDVMRAARRNAGRQILDLVDNADDRTRLGTLWRAFVPFGDAYARFWKRWSRIAIRNPVRVEQYRLLFGAGESMGWVHPDDKGNMVFTIPVMPQLAAALMPGSVELWEKWFSFSAGKAEEESRGQGAAKVILPQVLPYSVDIVPGFSPVVTIPADFAAMKLPSVRGISDFLMGESPGWQPDRSVPENVASHFLASWMRRMYTAFESADRNAAKGNAVKNAMAHLVKEFSDKHERMPNEKELQTLLRGDTSKPLPLRGGAEGYAFWDYIVQGLEAFFGLPVPNAPANIPYGLPIAKDWQELRANFGPEVGAEKFMQKYGKGAFMYTVGKSRTKGGAPIAFTPEAEKFAEQNPQLFNNKNYGHLAGFFTRDMGEDFDIEVYGRMRRRGAQEVLPPMDWVAQSMYLLGNREYYEVVRPKVEMLRATHKGEKANHVISLWLKKKQAEIDDKYPGWFDAWAKNSGNSLIKERDKELLVGMVEDPAVKDMPGTKAVAEFMKMYQAIRYGVYDRFGFTTLAARSLAPVRKLLAARAAEIQARTGSRVFEAVYNYYFRSELETLADEAQDVLEEARSARAS